MAKDSDLKAFTPIKIVSLEQAVAAPLTTRRFAQAGAEVIKIERPEGDFARYYDSVVFGESSYFAWLNAGKKSVVLDLAEDQSFEVLQKLIDRSDILVQNLKPGALQKLGFELDEYHRNRPEFISLSISGFHPEGPGKGRKAYDLLMQAESGLSSITGSPEEPGRVGVSMVDLATGMYGYQALLEALLNQRLTGAGKQIDISLFDAVAEWLAVPYLLDRYGHKAPERIGLAHPGICPYGVFLSADGQPFILSIQNEREWGRLIDQVIIERDLLEDPRCLMNEVRVENRRYVDDKIGGELKKLLYLEIENRFSRADLAQAPLMEIQDLKEHLDFRTYPALIGNNTFELPMTPGNDYASGQKVPELGEHTKAVIGSLE